MAYRKTRRSKETLARMKAGKDAARMARPMTKPVRFKLETDKMRKTLIILLITALCGCGRHLPPAQYTDPSAAPDGAYIVTFDNGAEELMWVKNGELWASEALAETQIARIRGYRPIKLVPVPRGQ